MREPLCATFAALVLSVAAAVPTVADPSLAPCTAANLRLTIVDDGEAGMMKVGGLLQLTNTSSARCSVRGYPRATVFDARGRPIATAGAARGGTYFHRDAGVRTIAIAPGGRAYASFVAANSTTGPGDAVRCRNARRLDLRVARRSRALTTPIRLRLCPQLAPGSPIGFGVMAFTATPPT